MSPLDTTGKILQENIIHSSVILNSLVSTNIFKLYSSILKPMNVTLYLLVGGGTDEYIGRPI
jgi:hypothetical protein